MIDQLYREEILEHYKNPQNFGKLKQFNASSKQLNPLCGDEIEIYVNFNLSSAGVATITPLGCKVVEIGFVGRGCAISIASCSILTEYTKGKTKKELTRFSQEDMLELLGIEVSETRKKCALLSWAVLQDSLQ